MDPPERKPPDPTLRTERLLKATSQQIFAAFERPERLAEWWGPNGFSNTFEVFEFRPGGRSIFTMCGPNGANYPYERIVLEHVVKPWYKLTVTLAPEGGQTRLNWEQEFESSEFAARWGHWQKLRTSRSWTGSSNC